MSHVLYWPGRNLFRPLGSASASPRKLDVTCCDIEAAVLARNALLFTLLADHDGTEDRQSCIWNIFYHLMLDEGSLSLLTEQCRKLVPLTESMDTWRQGPYSHFITMCNSDTLSEIGRFWKLWLGTSNFNAGQARLFKERFQDGIKTVRELFEDCKVIGSIRSAGPLAPVAIGAAAEQFKRFWATGVTDDGLRNVKPANHVNPTFAFSATSGDEFSLHCVTDPVSGFHLAETLPSCGLGFWDETPSVIFKIVQAAHQQFSRWCKDVLHRIRNTSASSALFVVRMYAGDALAFCQTLHSANAAELADHSPVFTAPWKRTVVQLDNASYGPSAPSPAPTSFDVIETSNMLDHLGLQNLLIATTPLLCHSPSSTLYTEVLLPVANSPAEGILEHACSDLSTISLLLGVTPSTYVSRFTTRSNSSEKLLLALKGPFATQYQDRLAWKLIGFGHNTNCSQKTLLFTPNQLTEALFDIYLKMFSDEDPSKQMEAMSLGEPWALQKLRSLSTIHYTRRTFALLLAHTKTRVQCDWDTVIDDLGARVLQNRTLITGSSFYQEMVSQLHLAGFRPSWLSPTAVQELRFNEDPPIFRQWGTVPEVVTIILVVPRHAITKVQSDLSDAGTPYLQCETWADFSHNAFACISASFGKLEVSGQGENKVAVVVEDGAGIKGTSPLIVSFPILSTCLMIMTGGTVCLAVRPTFDTMPLSRKLGLGMCLFKASLTDERFVHVLARAPTTSNDATTEVQPLASPTLLDATDEGYSIHVEMDKSNTRIQTLTAHIDIVDPAEQAALEGGYAITAVQLSPDKAKLQVGEYQRVVSFPLPVDIADAKLRVARKSKYVEVIAPMALTLGVKEERNITGSFKTAFDSGVPTLWGMHRVNLDRCPSFKLSQSQNAFDWFGAHTLHMFSEREHTSRVQRALLGRIPDTITSLKETLRTLFHLATGLGGETHAEFALCNPSKGDLYAIILVTGIRLDLAAHTVVADSWIIPKSDKLQDKLRREIPSLVLIKTNDHGSEAWRHLLPLLIERCRTWKHKASCEYLVHNSIPLYPNAGSDPNKVPWCSCGMGVGAEVLRGRYGSVAAKYANEGSNQSSIHRVLLGRHWDETYGCPAG
ncbi:hypothetical protein F5J12DRAFT_912959 [Pisolithus orientalis]|uniref:uncharacterized protein n=1 Tax=Pisolithus orientalis TaxID=936130 RepID=UPI00222426A0|nr:uncharacterized protein F5J12DRAFT_912959 [Pisolithus orientalis]KAI6007655.1 hypothetical protein F5J12DRAFT_912959 [Pisolithus orientalis]